MTEYYMCLDCKRLYEKPFYVCPDCHKPNKFVRVMVKVVGKEDTPPPP